MGKRTVELRKIYENVDKNIRVLICPLLQHVEDWEKRVKRYQSELNGIEMNRRNKERIIFVSRLLREAEQQYTNVMKVLISALNRNSVEQDDEFDKFLQEMRKGD